MSLLDSPMLWVLIGAGLMISELFTLTFVIGCFGAGALLTSIAAFAGVDHIGGQSVVFATTSLALILIMRTYFPRAFRGTVTERSSVPEDDTGLMGMPGRVEQPFVCGRGTIIVNGVKWDAIADQAMTLNAGDPVVVTGKSGINLQVAQPGQTE